MWKNISFLCPIALTAQFLAHFILILSFFFPFVIEKKTSYYLTVTEDCQKLKSKIFFPYGTVTAIPQDGTANKLI